MRLIDADELEDRMLIYYGDYTFNIICEEIRDFFRNTPTVKAIPIEWIEKEIKRTSDITDEKELDVLYAGNLSYMLKLWEKRK